MLAGMVSSEHRAFAWQPYRKASGMAALPYHLKPNLTPGARLDERSPGVWRLEIPAGRQGPYRLAQMDDYEGRRRSQFSWRAPLRLSLRARASSADIQGTWGFGLWNDPFGMAILRGVEMLRLPTFPDTAWFFFASSPNYLSIRDDLPARGALAATFRSPRARGPLLALAAPVAPLLWLPATRGLVRAAGRRFLQQDACQLDYDPSGWHSYRIDLEPERASFSVDGETVLETEVSPRPPLGLVIWVDNQYAALPPDAPPSFGTLANPEPAWIEIRDLEIDGRQD